MVIIRIDKSADLIDANNHLKMKGRWLIFINLNMLHWNSKEAREISHLFATSRPHDLNVLYSGKSNNIDKRILAMTDFTFKKSRAKFVLTNIQGKVMKRF